MHCNIYNKFFYILVSTVRDALQTLRDDVPTQKYPVKDFITLVIVSELLVVFPLVLVIKLILPPFGSTITVVLLSFMNLYHCTSSLLMLLFNTQVNTASFSSHIVTSSGSLITTVNVKIRSHFAKHLANSASLKLNKAIR